KLMFAQGEESPIAQSSPSRPSMPPQWTSPPPRSIEPRREPIRPGGGYIPTPPHYAPPSNYRTPWRDYMPPPPMPQPIHPYRHPFGVDPHPRTRGIVVDDERAGQECHDSLPYKMLIVNAAHKMYEPQRLGDVKALQHKHTCDIQTST